MYTRSRKLSIYENANEFLETKTTMCEMKHTMGDGFNSRLETVKEE